MFLSRIVVRETARERNNAGEMGMESSRATQKKRSINPIVISDKISVTSAIAEDIPTGDIAAEQFKSKIQPNSQPRCARVPGFSTSRSSRMLHFADPKGP